MAQVQMKKLKVIELAGRGTPILGTYGRYAKKNGIFVSLKSVDALEKHYEERPREMKDKFVDFSFSKSTVQNFVRKKVRADHLHFHMLDAHLSQKEAAEIVMAASRILKPDGLFFFSANRAFFDKPYEHTVFAEISGKINSNFKVLLEFCNDPHMDFEDSPVHWNHIKPVLRKEAKELGNRFEFSPKNPWDAANLFARFSAYADRLGQYFAIGEKKS